MAINDFEIREYQVIAESRLTMAFEQKPIFAKYLKLLLAEQGDLQEVLRQLMQERSIETAVGKQLDIIGDIVGQPRELIEADFIPYFGYVGAFDVQSYGDLNNASLGGYYYDLNQSLVGNILLNDDQYRIFIKAKILKNITRATPEDTIYFIQFVFGADKVQIAIDNAAEQALILVSQDLNQFEVALLKYFSDKPYKSYFIPKSLGVGITFGGIPTGRFFSFLGVDEGMGYGDLSDPSLGGMYASIYA